MFGTEGMTLGIVVAVYPEGNSLDVLIARTGARLANVQIACFTGSSNTGLMDLPEIGLPVDDSRWDITIQGNGERYVRAIMSHVDGKPICMGILLPQLTQMTFQRNNFRVSRHASDVYSTINAQGDTEWSHPSGSFMRVAGNPAHENLSALDVDKSWAIKQNTGSAPWFNLTVANAGSVVANLTIDPAGNVSLANNGNLTATVGGNLQATIAGTTTVDSTGAAKVKAPSVTVDSPQSTFTGAVTIQGPLVFESGMTGSAGSSGGSTMTIDGDAHYTGTVSADTDVLAAGKSGKGHIHADPQGGDVGPPI